MWAGTYVAAAGSGTAFDTGYWQYGEMLKLKHASFIAVGSTLTGLLALLLF